MESSGINAEKKYQLEGLASTPAKIINGIPCFDDSGYFYSFITNRQKISDLVNLAVKMGWRRAVLARTLGDDWLRDYITDPSRTLFLSILEINEGYRVLDAGAGYGNVSAQIAKGFPTTKVYAFDRNIESLFFADQIRKQERLENMHIIQGNITDPPFEKNFFDVTIMIGLLEWIGASDQTSSPRAHQLNGLRAIHSLLKPGGRLLIGIENRIGFKYFKGAEDDHSRLRYTTLMPRYMASLYMKAKGRGSYRTYTYSRGGYERLLREAGFEEVSFYVPIPDYHFPTRICDLESVKTFTRVRGARVLPQRIVREFANSFYILARKSV